MPFCCMHRHYGPFDEWYLDEFNDFHYLMNLPFASITGSGSEQFMSS